MIADARTGHELFEAIFDAAAVGVALVDLKGHFVTSNHAFQAMLGYSDDELKGRRFVEFTHADDAGAHTALFAELLGGMRDSYELAKRFVRRDGSVAHVQVTASRVRDNYVLGIIKDVTREWETRAERDHLLEQLEKRVRELTTLHQAARVLDQHDLTMPALIERIVLLIPWAFERPEEIRARVTYGTSVSETPDVQEQALPLSSTFETRDGTPGSIAVGRSREHGPAEEPFLAEEHALIETLAEMLGSRLERSVAEHQLRRSQERLGVALTSVDMGFWEWDVPSDQMVWSDEMSRLCGLPAAPINGRFGERFHLIHRDDVAMVRETVRSALADMTRRTLECEFRIIRPTDDERCLLARAHIFRNGAGESVRVLGVMIDITNRRQLQQQLLEAQKLEAVGRFASGIAHDFNNVLSIIVGQCDVMRVGTVARAVLTKGLGDIAEAAERASHMTQQLLTFSREGNTDPQVVNPGTVVARLAGYLQSVAGEHQVQLDLSTDLHNIVIDQQQLEQAIVNLVVNARDASPAMGIITVAASNATDGRVTVSVTDTGTGIDKRTLAHLFEPFSTTKRTPQGAGLGLAVVRTVVEGAGGEVRVDTAPGRGTTFELHFPPAA